MTVTNAIYFLKGIADKGVDVELSFSHSSSKKGCSVDQIAHKGGFIHKAKELLDREIAASCAAGIYKHVVRDALTAHFGWGYSMSNFIIDKTTRRLNLEWKLGLK